MNETNNEVQRLGSVNVAISLLLPSFPDTLAFGQIPSQNNNDTVHKVDKAVDQSTCPNPCSNPQLRSSHNNRTDIQSPALSPQEPPPTSYRLLAQYHPMHSNIPYSGADYSADASRGAYEHSANHKRDILAAVTFQRSYYTTYIAVAIVVRQIRSQPSIRPIALRATPMRPNTPFDRY